MRIHEYQAKELLRRAGIATPAGRLARAPEEAARAAEGLARPLVVKAQILAGGRGKAGGVVPAADPAAAAAAAGRLLGRRLVTAQTGPEGCRVRAVLVEEAVPPGQEFYCGLTIDRRNASILVLCGPGGVEVEAGAAALARAEIDPLIGLRSYHLHALARPVAAGGRARQGLAAVVRACYQLFTGLDCRLIEINPLLLLPDGCWLALDAKIEFDDNALFRHPELAALRDPADYPSPENEAAAHGLSYVALDGSIGTMVNGAGLAMATLDLIVQAGCRPANFLDVGGGASAPRIARGFRLVAAAPRVDAVFVNVFGGILRCDELARGLVAGMEEVGRSLPVLVRLAGTNADSGRRILASARLPVTVCQDLAAAVRALGRLSGSRQEQEEGR